MLRRLLFSGLAGYGIFLFACGLYLVYVNIPGTGFRYDKEIFSIEVQSLLIGLFVILGLAATVVTFLKVKTKNTIIEDIIINKAKIIKAEQERKLHALKDAK